MIRTSPHTGHLLGGMAALWALTFAWIPASGADEGQDESPYFNRKEVPEGIRDLKKIQEALQENLPRSRSATVSIDLGGGSGSGVIVSEEGLVLTAAHVSGGVGKKMTVIMEDGTRHAATSLGLVASTDAAMIRIDEEGSYPYVEVDKKDTAGLGDWVYALGHSGGFDKERGVGVRIGRLVRMADQTIDMKGRLIGIHSRVGQTLEQNMHVPIREFMNHWDGMIENEFIGEGPFAQKGGVAFMGVGTELREEGGLLVKVVGEMSPAEKAGIKVGDVILEMDGEKVEAKDAFSAAIKEYKVGDKVTLRILRDDEEIEVEVELGEKK